MYSIPHAVEEILLRRPYISELLEQDLINITQLARQIEAEVEGACMKEVSTEAVAMAIRRLPKLTASLKLKSLFEKSPDILVRSHLSEITVKKQDSLYKVYELLDGFVESKGQFLTITQGIFEDTIIVGKDYMPRIQKMFTQEHIIAEFTDLAAVTIRLHPSNVETPGVYYYILKSLLLENINIVEVVSTYMECTILVKEEDAGATFGAVKKLFRSP
ncbi:hypothetical protein KBB12_02785 [Candidatus Woesebacteria bacterium]|nr:hypothetical protein [Candidatus Woesebacteria bacterium]